MKKVLLIIFISALFCSCNEPPLPEGAVDAEDLHASMQALTDVIVYDIFSPPVASRIYSYASIAPYEVLAVQDSTYQSLAGQLNGLEPLPVPEEKISYEIAALNAHFLVGKALIFSEERLEDHRQEWIKGLKVKGVGSEILKRSLAYGEEAALHILRWSSFDNYKETRTFQKHTISNVPHRWQPTPPAYMEAIELHWSKIRPFAIDSANQFLPGKPTRFNIDEKSSFYKEVLEVYETGKSLDEEQKDIAKFWDCNPYAMNFEGHVIVCHQKDNVPAAIGWA